ncbi:MAG: iron-sulfur cluster repair di-iron protein [Firmicutes bacterium]|nr:iron-sulfur cluster repair di-iron protein [Bacillota bacterium]
MKRFNSIQNIGDIVVDFPKAAELFKELKIDFCCGGNRPLAIALKEQKLDEEKVMAKLNELYEVQQVNHNNSDRDWNEATIGELVKHIVDTHHAYLWSELPKMSEYVTKILRVHGENHPELLKVHKLFHMVKMELEEHLVKEETNQYPAIYRYLETKDKVDLIKAVKIIAELEAEHTAAGDILKELRLVTNDYLVPDDACRSYDLTYLKLVEMESDIFQHIHLENNILFPKLEALTNK